MDVMRRGSSWDGVPPSLVIFRRSAVAFIMAISAFSAAAAAPAQAAFTLEQVMGAPFPSDLIAARQGERVAWVENRRGERNVWVAEGPGFVARQVTHYRGDDGQPIASLRLSPDGSTVVYARGTEVNEANESANPARLMPAPKQQVWALDVASGAAGKAEPRLLGDMGCAGEGCEDIEISPDGRSAVWAARHKLWLASISGTPSPSGTSGSSGGSAPSGKSGSSGSAGTSSPSSLSGGSAHPEISAAAGTTPGAMPGAARSLHELQGDSSEPHWSPDGKRLAVRLDRRDHSYIVIFDVAAGGVMYVAPSADRDEMPRWSPDGLRLAFVREPAVGEREPLIPERPRPWSLWVADTTTGAARQVWQSDSGASGSLPPFASSSLLYAAGERLVFASEQGAGGRNHLYSLTLTASGAAASSSEPRLLTPGDYDVEDVTLSADGRSVLFSANEHAGDPADEDRRHLWRVGVDGASSPTALSPGAGIEWSPVETGDGKAVLCLGSGATSPAAAYRLTAAPPGSPASAAGRQPLAATPASAQAPADFPSSAELVVPRQVVFKSADGLTIHGQLFLPHGAAPEHGLPALVFSHGGPVRQMLLGFHYMYYYHNAYAMNQYLASRGYAVLAVNYRLGIMYGREFREAPRGAWRGSSEYADVVAAAHFLQAQPEVNPHRIGLWGGSYGGLLTALGLARNSDLFAAGVDFHGVHDWSLFLPQWEGSPAAAPDAREAYELARKSSPVAAVDTWRSPVLLIHGDDDRNVPFSQTRDLSSRLRARGVQFEELIFPDEIHDLLLWKDWVQAYAATAGFLDRHLK